MNSKKEEEFKPPNKEELRRSWLSYGGGGIALFCLGLCLFSEAGNLKHTGRDTATWILFGTISLICIGAGLSFFGESVLVKGQLDHRERQREFNKRRKKNNFSKPKKNTPKTEPKAEQ